MAAYIISRVKVKDPELMKEYAARSIALAKTYGASYPVRTNRVEALEGTYDGRRLIIIQFPDLASARAYWDSAAYQELREMRHAAADSELWLVPEN
jgi:uncharacterized protein (DUF1330 family)